MDCPAKRGQLSEHAKEIQERHKTHVLGIAHKNGMFGLRTKITSADDLRQAMGLTLRANFVMKGIPVDASQEFVTNLLLHIEWEAVPVQDHKRIRKGWSEWLIHAKQPPKDFVYHIDAQSVKLQV